MRSARWLPRERLEESEQRPYLEAPSPYDYRPLHPPKAESQQDEEEQSRVIEIEM